MPPLQNFLVGGVTGLPILDSITASRYGDLATAGIILGVSLGVAFFVHFLMNLYLSAVAKKTKTDVDDAIVSALKKPMYLAVIVTGLYVALRQVVSLLAYVPLITRLYQAAAIVIIAYAASKVVAAIISWLAKRRPAGEAKGADVFLPLAGKFVSIFIYVIAFIGVLDQLNIKVTALVASLGVASLAVALALQDTLANFFAGIYVMADRPVRAGDFVRLENGEDGYVEEIGWRSTKVRTLPNNIIVIPNSKLAQSVITNYYLPSQETSFVVKCGVAYGSDLEKVEKVTVKVAKEVQQGVEGTTRGFEPFIRFNEFGDSNINFSIIMRVDEPVAKYLVLHELIKRVAKTYQKEGIEISWPVRKVHLNK
ncbi:mechanosensitive ion channel family protein [Candidatus Woesearchaeota archaeon]|nr:mechanosensitive ion channel family protein [Candidatus Woesearchaeota archaeon]